MAHRAVLLALASLLASAAPLVPSADAAGGTLVHECNSGATVAASNQGYAAPETSMKRPGCTATVSCSPRHFSVDHCFLRLHVSVQAVGAVDVAGSLTQVGQRSLSASCVGSAVSMGCNAQSATTLMAERLTFFTFSCATRALPAANAAVLERITCSVFDE